MGFINRKQKKEVKTEREERAKRALEILSDETYLRTVYDYNLMTLVTTIERELNQRKAKRDSIINSLQDMCEWIIKWDEEEHTFYYSQKDPEQLMEAYDDDISAAGFENICRQIGLKGEKLFSHKGRAFRVTAYISEEGSEGESYFKMRSVSR